MSRMNVDERTHRIVSAAATVIVRDGIGQATTRRIAEEAGVPLGLIHYAFSDKQNLFAAVYEYWMGSTISTGVALIEPGSGLSRAARTLAEAVLSWAERDLNLASAQYELLLWANRSAPALAETMYQQWADLWGSALHQAAEPGTDPDAVREVLEHLLVIVDGVFVRLLSTRDIADVRRILDRALTHVDERLDHAACGR